VTRSVSPDGCPCSRSSESGRTAHAASAHPQSVFMREAIEAARRRESEAGTTASIASPSPASRDLLAEDPFAVVPQHLEATVRTSAEPKDGFISRTRVNLRAQRGRHTALPAGPLDESSIGAQSIAHRSAWRSSQLVIAPGSPWRVFRRVVSGGAEGDDVEPGNALRATRRRRARC